MMIVAPRKVIGLENSVNSGGMPYALLSEKQPKLSAKLISVNCFRGAKYLVCPRSTLLFRFDCHSNTKVPKAISIAAS